jgi:Putative peptidoglycan binding domain
MNGERFCRSRARGAIRRSWLTVRSVAVGLLTVASIGITGCARSEPVQKSVSLPIEKTTTPQPPRENPVGQSLPAEPQLLEGTGGTVWAKEFPGNLIAGLDGDLYEPYKHKTIERVQKALGDRGLYAGPVNGILDRPTMKSIYAFQEANYNLQRCGVPTPHTRQMLAQGSHTDFSTPIRH